MDCVGAYDPANIDSGAVSLDYPRKSGGAAIGARLRRLSEVIDGDASRVYSARGIRFEQRWFGVLNQLDRNGTMAVSELAIELRITHASISQTRQSLETAGLIVSDTDPNDSRRRQLAITSAGHELLEQLRPLWRAFAQAAADLDAEAGNVVDALDRLEDALGRRSMFERITQELEKQPASSRSPSKAKRAKK